jgi:hypothetical protein
MGRAGRLAWIRVSMRCRARASHAAAKASAHIEQVQSPARLHEAIRKNVEIELVIKTRRRPHIESFFAALRAAGLRRRSSINSVISAQRIDDDAAPEGRWKLKCGINPATGTTMSSPADHTTNAAHGSATPAQEQDVVEAIVPMIPLVLPLVGGVLMFLLAFIAIYMA